MSPQELQNDKESTTTPGQQASHLIELLRHGIAEPPPSSAVERLLETGTVIGGVLGAPPAEPDALETPTRTSNSIAGVESRSEAGPLPRIVGFGVRQTAFKLVKSGAKISLLVMCAYALLFNFSVVRGNSMEPGIHDGDRILVNHLGLVFSDVSHGDIVVLRYPLDPTVDYIKRVVGIPGDRIKIDGGAVFVNGEELREPYVIQPDPYTKLEIEVMADHFFVLGDNRMHSSDSREFGQVPAAFLRGRVDIRVWPPSRVGTVR